MRFIKCLVTVTVVHFGAALIVTVAYFMPKPSSKELPNQTAGQENPVAAVTQLTTATPAENLQPQNVEHVVKSGESYWSIAKKYQISPGVLMRTNGHGQSHVLRTGEKLTIPTK